jgi:hypothetical protein
VCSCHVTGVAASTFALLIAAAVPPSHDSDDGGGGGGGTDAEATSRARHAAGAFAVTAVALLLCCGAHAALQTVPSLRADAPLLLPSSPHASQTRTPSRRRRRAARVNGGGGGGGGGGFVDDAAAPLLAGSSGEEAEDAEEQECSDGDGDADADADADVNADVNAGGAQGDAPDAEAQRTELRLYQLVRRALVPLPFPLFSLLSVCASLCVAFMPRSRMRALLRPLRAPPLAVHFPHLHRLPRRLPRRHLLAAPISA